MKPPAEITIDESTVRALLWEQHRDLAHLPLVRTDEGWDNVLFRLGDDLAVRVPRRTAAVSLIENEQRWLPVLSPRLPLPIPVPRRVGGPGCGLPWPWSITSWLPGQSALLAPPRDLRATAVTLAEFLRGLHQPAPEDAPHNPWRGVPLAARTSSLREHLDQLKDLVNRDAVLQLWEESLATPSWTGPPLWIHGDLHPGNLLVCDGCLSAVIDFGDLTAGDPATDLSVMWMLFPSALHSTFVEAVQSDSIDHSTFRRARGWALALGLAYLASSGDDTALGSLGLATVRAVVNN